VNNILLSGLGGALGGAVAGGFLSSYFQSYFSSKYHSDKQHLEDLKNIIVKPLIDSIEDALPRSQSIMEIPQLFRFHEIGKTLSVEPVHILFSDFSENHYSNVTTDMVNIFRVHRDLN